MGRGGGYATFFFLRVDQWGLYHNVEKAVEGGKKELWGWLWGWLWGKKGLGLADLGFGPVGNKKMQPPWLCGPSAARAEDQSPKYVHAEGFKLLDFDCCQD